MGWLGRATADKRQPLVQILGIPLRSLVISERLTPRLLNYEAWVLPSWAVEGFPFCWPVSLVWPGQHAMGASMVCRWCRAAVTTTLMRTNIIFPELRRFILSGTEVPADVPHVVLVKDLAW